MNSTTKIPVTDLNPHLLCVLCGGYLIDATTIVECIHSFCRTCITRYLESSKYCPICDVQVHKTRPLNNVRSDKTLQTLVYKLVPGLFKDEMRRRRDFYAANPDKEKPSPSTAVNANEQRGDVQQEDDISSKGDEEKISLCLQHCDRLPPYKNGSLMATIASRDDGKADKRYFLCPSGVTIGHLKKLLRIKFDLPSSYRLDVFYSDESLRDVYTLLDVAHIYTWRRSDPLKLYYIVYDKTVSHLHLTPPSVKDVNQLIVTGLKPAVKSSTRKRKCAPDTTPKKSARKVHDISSSESEPGSPQVPYQGTPQAMDSDSGVTVSSAGDSEQSLAVRQDICAHLEEQENTKIEEGVDDSSVLSASSVTGENCEKSTESLADNSRDPTNNRITPTETMFTNCAPYNQMNIHACNQGDVAIINLERKYGTTIEPVSDSLPINAEPRDTARVVIPQDPCNVGNEPILSQLHGLLLKQPNQLVSLSQKIGTLTPLQPVKIEGQSLPKTSDINDISGLHHSAACYSQQGFDRDIHTNAQRNTGPKNIQTDISTKTPSNCEEKLLNTDVANSSCNNVETTMTSSASDKSPSSDHKKSAKPISLNDIVSKIRARSVTSQEGAGGVMSQEMDGDLVCGIIPIDLTKTSAFHAGNKQTLSYANENITGSVSENTDKIQSEHDSIFASSDEGKAPATKKHKPESVQLSVEVELGSVPLVKGTANPRKTTNGVSLTGKVKMNGVTSTPSTKPKISEFNRFEDIPKTTGDEHGQSLKSKPKRTRKLNSAVQIGSFVTEPPNKKMKTNNIISSSLPNGLGSSKQNNTAVEMAPDPPDSFEVVPQGSDPAVRQKPLAVSS